MRAIDIIEYFITYTSYASIIVFSILLFKKKVPKSIKANISKIVNNSPYRSSFEDEEKNLEEDKTKVNDVKEKEFSFREELKKEAAKYNKEYAENFYKDHIEISVINASKGGLSQIKKEYYFSHYPSLETSYDNLYKIIRSKGLDVGMHSWSNGVAYTISWK